MMSRKDYAHHNEEAYHIWWQEEGKFAGDPEHEHNYDRLEEERAFFEEDIAHEEDEDL